MWLDRRQTRWGKYFSRWSDFPLLTDAASSLLWRAYPLINPLLFQGTFYGLLAMAY